MAVIWDSIFGLVYPTGASGGASTIRGSSGYRDDGGKHRSQSSDKAGPGSSPESKPEHGPERDNRLDWHIRTDHLPPLPLPLPMPPGTSPPTSLPPSPKVPESDPLPITTPQHPHPNLKPRPHPKLQTSTYRLLPVFAGTMIPFSILLSVPGLTSKWYIQTMDNVTVATRDNPFWLVLAMGWSVGCAALANGFLVVRFVKEGPKWVRIATVGCVGFLSLHDCISISALTTFGVRHRFDDGFTYGQPFWMTICATVVSSLTNVILVVDWYRTARFAQSGSGLSSKQRSLLVVVIVLLVYVATGALIFTFLQKIDFIDALYFSVVSIETIGFGDIPPSTTPARVFTCLFVAGGILNLGLLVAVSRHVLLEAAAEDFEARLGVWREKLRRKQVRKRWRAAVKWHLRAGGVRVWVRKGEGGEDGDGEQGRSWFPSLSSFSSRFWGVNGLVGRGGKKSRSESPVTTRTRPRPRHHRHHRRRLNVEALTPTQLEAAAMEAGAPLSTLIPAHIRARLLRQQEELARTGKEGSVDVPVGDHNYGPTNTNTSERKGIPMTPSLSITMSTRHQQHQHHHQPLTHVRLGVMSSLLGKFAVGVAHGESHVWRHDLPGAGRSATHGSSIVDADADIEAGDRVRDDDEDDDHCGAEEGHHDEEDEEEYEDEDDHDHTEDHHEHSAFRPNSLPPRTGVPFSRSVTMDVEDELPGMMESEEKVVLYARLCVAWGLFFVFWIGGSAIFVRTEGWSFGSSVYFCFMAFTTVGYGDLAPRTPAGRSIFVVWALLGVGTMTMLISILTEAYSDRYRRLIKSQLDDIKSSSNRKTPLSTADITVLPSTATTAIDTAFSTSDSQPFNEKLDTASTTVITSPATTTIASNTGTQVKFLLPSMMTATSTATQGQTQTRLRQVRRRASTNDALSEGGDQEVVPPEVERRIRRHVQTVRSLMQIPLMRDGSSTGSAQAQGQGQPESVRIETVQALFEDIERSLRAVLSETDARREGG